MDEVRAVLLLEKNKCKKKCTDEVKEKMFASRVKAKRKTNMHR